MNPLYVQLLKAFLVPAIAFLMGWMVTQGAMTEEQARETGNKLAEVLVPIISGLVAVAVTAYNSWNASKQQQLLVTAQAMPAGVSTKEVIAASKSEFAPSSMLPRDEAPRKIARIDVEGNDAA